MNETSSIDPNAWWQNLITYGVSRAVDSEFVLPYTTQNQANQIGMGANGRYYTAGQPSGFAAIASNPTMMMGGMVLLGLVLFMALRD